MPYYAKSEDWLHQSALLLQARPSTTRITTRYHLKPARRTPKPPKSADTTTAAAATTTTTQQSQEKEQAQTSKPPRGHLVLKTFDPSSGVTLKYKTSKAAEVTRLVQMLGALGKRMAGVVTAAPEKVGAAGVGGDEVVMADAAGAAAAEGGEGVGAGSGSGAQTPVAAAGAGAGQQQQGQQGQQQGGGGGKGKKKKGKR